MSRKTYQMNVAREGRWWIINVPEIDYRTQARKLSEIEHMGRDLIATMEDIEADSFDVVLIVQMPADIEQQLGEATRLERESREAASRAAHDRRAVARTLRDSYGLSAPDVAQVLGVTRARVYQLLDEKEKASA